MSCFKQLCWKCNKATNEKLCIWVRTLKEHYIGTQFDKEGYIVSCPKFEKDNFQWFKREKATDKELAKLAGVSAFAYRRARIKIKEEHLHVSVEEYLKLKAEKGFYKAEAKRLGISESRYHNFLQFIRKKGLAISVEEHLKEIEQKKLQTKIYKMNAKKLGISLGRYRDIGYYIQHKKLNISVEEYLKRKREKNGK